MELKHTYPLRAWLTEHRQVKHDGDLVEALLAIEQSDRETVLIFEVKDSNETPTQFRVDHSSDGFKLTVKNITLIVSHNIQHVLDQVKIYVHNNMN